MSSSGSRSGGGFVRLNLLSLTMTLGRHHVPAAGGWRRVAFPLAMSTLGTSRTTPRPTNLADPLARCCSQLMVGTLSVFFRFGPSRENAPRWWFSPGALVAALRLARGLGGAVVLSVRTSPTTTPPTARSAPPSA